ncbi:MAG TPA: hypothetical protein DCO79_13470 [Spirochaeta sp.]|nr:hypothetical protein [Spirochaeta sp.]
MKKILSILLLAFIVTGVVTAASFNIDEQQEIDLSGINKIIFELKRPNCALCISTGSQTYSIYGGSRNGQLALSLEGDLKSNNKKAVPALMPEKNGEVLTIRLYKETGLFFGLVQNSSVQFTAELPKYFDGDIEIQTSSGDSVVTDINSKEIRIKSSSGDVEAARIEADIIEITASSGDTKAVELSAVSTLKIKSSSGNVEIDELLSAEADIHASSGRINIGRLRTVEDLVIHASSGRITADSLEAGDALIEASSGKIMINELQSNNTIIDSSSGSIEVSQLTTGDADIDCSSGKTSLGIVEIGGNINVKSSSGDVAIALPADSAFDVDLSASSGKIKSAFKVLGEIDSSRKNEIIGEVNGGGHTIKIKASSGDITIEER